MAARFLEIICVSPAKTGALKVQHVLEVLWRLLKAGGLSLKIEC